MADSSPKIIQYADYRLYLKDWWSWRKRNSRVASFRSFAAKAGTAPSLLADVLEGRRRLTQGAMEKFAKAMQLDEKERRYFSLLVEFGNATTSKLKNEAFAGMARMRSQSFLKFLPPDQYSLWSEWHHAAIRELVGTRGFKEDPAWIATRLQPEIPPKKAKESLEILQRVGLIRRTPKGKLQASEPVVSSEYDPPSEVVRHFNQQMIAMGMTAPDRFPAGRREISGLTVSLSQECYERIKERVRFFKEELLTMILEEGREAELVAQLNIQLFPLSEVEPS